MSPPARLLLEVPSPWLLSELPEERYRYATMYASLCIAAARLDTHVELVDGKFGADLAPRLPALDQVVVAFHSYGEEANVWRLKESYLPGYFTLDRMGYSGFSELSRHPERFMPEIRAFGLERAQRAVNDARKLLAETGSKYPQKSADLADMPDDVVFFPLQTEDDPVRTLSRIRQLDALVVLAERAQEHGRTLVIKRHPHCQNPATKAKIDDVLTRYPGVLFTDASIHKLFTKSACVVGGNSGVLFEAALHGKPVFSFADSDFNMVTKRLESVEEIDRVFQDTSGFEMPSERVRFLGWYLEQYCLVGSDPDSFERRLRLALSDFTKPVGDPEASARRELMLAFARIESSRRETISTMRYGKYIHHVTRIKKYARRFAYWPDIRPGN